MRILYVADASSPIALNWISYFVGKGHEVHVVSTDPRATGDPQFASFRVVATGLNKVKGVGAGSGRSGPKAIVAGLARKLMVAVRQKLPTSKVIELSAAAVERDLPNLGERLSEIVREIQPDLIHAMRIPNEGIFAASATRSCPLLVSIWGNDFTLYASSSPRYRRLIRAALSNIDALHSDCHRDARLAKEEGFDPSRRIDVLPGSGGVQRGLFRPGATDRELLKKQGVDPESDVLIINARGWRTYVRNDILFQAMPQVVRKHPKVKLLCVGMQGSPQPEEWVNKYKLQENVKLLGKFPREQMASLFGSCLISVSPSEHDGTPNTLLEAMACGAFPVAGNIESVREWITDGDNGLLCAPDSVDAVASALCRALEDEDLRRSALQKNQQIVGERADYAINMARAEQLYADLIGQT